MQRWTKIKRRNREWRNTEIQKNRKINRKRNIGICKKKKKQWKHLILHKLKKKKHSRKHILTSNTIHGKINTRRQQDERHEKTEKRHPNTIHKDTSVKTSTRDDTQFDHQWIARIKEDKQSK